MNQRKIALDNGHFSIEEYKQRMTKKEWEEMLLNYEDKIIVKGNVRQLRNVKKALNSESIDFNVKTFSENPRALFGDG